MRRGIIGSGILGAKWAVFHIGTVYGEDGLPDDEASFKANVEYLRPLLRLAKENGVDHVGICWDFGHAIL